MAYACCTFSLLAGNPASVMELLLPTLTYARCLRAR